MKRFLSMLFLVLILVSAGNAFAATYKYVFDININSEAISDIEYKIGGIEFSVTGGDYEVDWTVELGDAVPEQGNWWYRFAPEISLFGLMDDFEDYDEFSDCAPLQAGRVLTISSTKELTFDRLLIADYYYGDPVSNNYYSTAGIEALVDNPPVPAPSALILVASGIIGLAGLRRRQ